MRIKKNFMGILVFMLVFVILIIGCDDSYGSNSFVGIWNGVDSYGNNIEVVISETKWIAFLLDYDDYYRGTYTFNKNNATFINSEGNIGGTGVISGNKLSINILGLSIILTNNGTPVGTFQFRITGIPNNFIECLEGEHWFGARMFTNNGNEVLVAYTFDYEIGGDENNYWIQFYLFNVTKQSNGNITVHTEKYINVSGYFDLHFWVLGPNEDWISYSMIWHKKFDVNTTNVVPYSQFHDLY